MTRFVDTNILLYVTSRASEEARKRTVALDLLAADNLALSVQYSRSGGRNLMIKQGDLKYEYYGPDMQEVLFNLATDPQERVNLIGEPAFANHCRRFRWRCGELGFGPDANPNYVNAAYHGCHRLPST